MTTTRIVAGMDNDASHYESVRVEHAAHGIIYLNIEKDGHSLGLYVEKDELLAALKAEP